MKFYKYWLSLAFMLVCTSCNEKESMFNQIQNAGVVIVEFTNINDPSILMSPKAQSHLVTSDDDIAKISNILSSNSEDLHSSLNSSTLPFGYISTYDLAGERLLVFKLNSTLSNKIKTVITDKNKEDMKEVDLFFTNFSSNEFNLLPKNNPLAMSYKITKTKFEKAVGAYRENAR